MDCPPANYLHTPESFQTTCLTGSRFRNNSTKETVTYTRDIPKKAIHLIRNPFDNLVGRMHLFNKHHANEKSVPHVFNTTQQGIVSWCHYLDDKYAAKEDKTILASYSHVPCHAEWYRYVQWHNLAWETTRVSLQLPVQYLYYEDYDDERYNATLYRLLQFLEMRQSASPLAFLASGKTYQKVFAQEHVQAAKRMVQQLACPEVWKLLERYF
jgi:hypothetical protein